MTRLKQLLLAVVGAAATIAMLLLGLWQMQVFQSQVENSTTARAQLPVVDLESHMSDGHAGEVYGRPVSSTGSYLPVEQVLVGTEYPLRVVSAFRTTGGRTLPVVRGLVSQGEPVPPVPRGRQTVTGVILPSQARETVPLAPEVPAGTIGSMRLEVVAQRWPLPMVDGFVTQQETGARAQGLAPAAVEIPEAGGGKARNRGYALQWWAFGIFAAVATVVGIRSLGARERTR